MGEASSHEPSGVRPSLSAITVLTVLLCLAAAFLVAPLWVPLVLAAWFADLLGPAVRRLEALLGGRRRAAGALIVLLAVCVLLPLVGVVAALTTAVRELLDQVRAALEGQGSLASVVLGGAGEAPNPGRDWAALASRYGTNAWSALTMVARASATAAIGAFVFVAALYSFTVDGARSYAWLEEHAPLPRAELARLAGAFRETGRGLIVAEGGTALVQGAIATAGYLAIGVPRGIIFGPLTAVCALVPFVGTGLVWVPLAIGLGTSGQYWRAGLLLAFGFGVLSLVDNFVRPMLARYGHLHLPTFVVLISMLGGAAALGATGALLGPLVVRLSVEALAIVAERRRRARSPAEAREEPLASPPVDDAPRPSMIARRSG
jgi:predicted PurR-regulated permease PerM